MFRRMVGYGDSQEEKMRLMRREMQYFDLPNVKAMP
jgi:hypothetical protein